MGDYEYSSAALSRDHLDLEVCVREYMGNYLADVYDRMLEDLSA